MAALKSIGIALFGLSLLVSWSSSCSHYIFGQMPVYHGYVRQRGRLPGSLRTAAVVGSSVVFLVLTTAFCLGVWPVWTGLAVLAMMAVVRQLEIREWNYDIVVGLGKYVPAAAALLGYLAAYLLAQGLDLELTPDQAGWDGACGVLAGCWALAAIAKFRESGMRWTRSDNTALLVAERSYLGSPVLNRIRKKASRMPLVCLLAGNVGMWGELAGFGFVLPGLRWPIAIGLTFFQLGIWVLLGYVETEWILIMVALAAASGAPFPGLAG